MVEAFDRAMQATAPTESAMTAVSGPVQPRARNNTQVPMRAAIVIPEIGQDDEPTRPVMRDETTEKKKPKMTIRMAPSRLMPNTGSSQTRAVSTTVPPRITHIGRSRSVRGTSPPPPWRSAESWRIEAVNDVQMVGAARSRPISPPVATAPAPM